MDSLASEFSKARAVPWKVGSMLAGIPSPCVTCLMWSTALCPEAMRPEPG